MSKKLTLSDKVEISLSRQESLRELADRYGVHHSVIDDIFKESEKILMQYWDEKSKRKGRPPTPLDAQAELMAQTDSEKKELNKQVALKQMRIDWLELQLKWANERAAEAGLKPGKQLKKKKKSK
jgi:predicted DNA-binding protein YlxM (UPF0122 family)